MITITPNNPPEHVVRAINKYIEDHIVSNESIPERLKNINPNHIAWHIFSEWGITGKVVDDVFQIDRITRVGFDQLFDLYSRERFGIALTSLVFEDKVKGGVTKPLTGQQSDAAVANIIKDCNTHWQDTKSINIGEVGQLIYDVLSRYDHEIIVALQSRFESEASSNSFKGQQPWFVKLYSKLKK